MDLPTDPSSPTEQTRTGSTISAPPPRQRSTHLARPVMRMRWANLTYVHWAVEPEQVQRLLPEGLTADEFDGAAWVGLIPFHMRGIRPPGMPDVLPYVGTFYETNVRTYVLGPEGRRGVYFHSLDASRLGAVLVARGGYRLPYLWSKMDIHIDPPTIAYDARRRWPGPRGAVSHLRVEVGTAMRPDEIAPLDDFLSARWRLHVPLRDRLHRVEIEHEPWPLARGRVLELDDELVAAAGYGDLARRAPDHVRFSTGVDVLAGLPVALPDDDR